MAMALQCHPLVCVALPLLVACRLPLGTGCSTGGLTRLCPLGLAGLSARSVMCACGFMRLFIALSGLLLPASGLERSFCGLCWASRSRLGVFENVLDILRLRV